MGQLRGAAESVRQSEASDREGAREGQGRGEEHELAGGRLAQVLRAHPRRDGEVDQRDLGGHRGKEGDEQGEREITWQPEAEAAQVHEGTWLMMSPSLTRKRRMRAGMRVRRRMKMTTVTT